MKIGELAALSGLAASRIRFYEASGLIAKARRLPNGYRVYPQQTLRLLEIIATAQAAGFPLEEIRHLLPTPGQQTWNRERLLTSLIRKVDQIDAMQQRLKKTRQQILCVIRRIENKPSELGCMTNLEFVMASLKDTSSGTKGVGQVKAAVKKSRHRRLHEQAGARRAMRSLSASSRD
jgi:DNA-binding transcriptional MerR regulator